MDFDSRLSKFDKEKEKRKKLAKEKIAHEAKLQKLQEEREKSLAELAERKRIEQEEIDAQNELRELEENRITGGIKVLLTLQSIPINLENDKVKLPQSLLTELHEKGAFSCGRPVMFQIQPQSTNSSLFPPGRITHCGVLEFTAEEGTIEIPTKVYRNLFQFTESSPDLSSFPPPIVQIKYIALPKITSVQFQPKLNLFSQLGPIKLILEENLQQHATLTLGDVLTIWSRGQSHELIVTDLEPKDIHNGGTVIDTNIEVNLDYSEEYLQSTQTSQPTSSFGSGSRSVVPSPSPPPPSQSIQTQPQTQSLSSTSSSSSNRTSQPLRDLAPEPSPDQQFFVTFKFLFPSGGKAIRRFLLNSSIEEIFLFLRHLNLEGKHVIDENKMIQISTRQAPIRVYKEQDEERTLQQQIEQSGLVTLPHNNGATLTTDTMMGNTRHLSEVLAVSYV